MLQFSGIVNSPKITMKKELVANCSTKMSYMPSYIFNKENKKNASKRLRPHLITQGTIYRK